MKGLLIQKTGQIALLIILCFSMETGAYSNLEFKKIKTQRRQMHLPPSTVWRSENAIRANAINLSKPLYAEEAKARRIWGRVIVEVMVDEFGKVIHATALKGHPLLRPTAIIAAQQSTFRPTLDKGVPKKVLGTLTYYFAKPAQREPAPNNGIQRSARSEILMVFPVSLRAPADAER